LLSIFPLQRYGSHAQGEKQDDPEPPLERRQLPQWLDGRRHHREKQEESDDTVLDQNRQEDVVGAPLTNAVGRRLEGRYVPASTHAEERMLLRHLQAGTPDMTTASEVPGLDVSAGGLDALQRRLRYEIRREQERPGSKGIQGDLCPKAQAPERPRNDHERHERRQGRSARTGEENRRDAEREIESPDPVDSAVRLRNAEVPRHRKAERQDHAELVRVKAEGRKPLRVIGERNAGQVVVYGGDGENACSQDVCLEQRPLALRRPRDLPDQPH